MRGPQTACRPFAAHDALQQTGRAAVGDDGGDARLHGAFDGLELGAMPPVDRRPFSPLARWSTSSTSSTTGMGSPRPSGVAGEALGAGQDDEQIGAREDGDFGGKPVVVAEAQFLDGDAVVFVDDGDDAAVFEQAVERVLGVGVAGAAVEVLMGEEQLRDGETVRGRNASRRRASAATGRWRRTPGSVGVSAGRSRRPSTIMPAPTAPLVTTRHSWPRATSAAISAVSRWNCASSRVSPRSLVSRPVPSLMTRRAGDLHGGCGKPGQSGCKRRGGPIRYRLRNGKRRRTRSSIG